MGEWAAAAGAVAHVVPAPLDDECVIDGDDGHHLQRVRRVREGEIVTTADGAGSWRRYEVVELEPGRLRLRATHPRQREPQLRPALGVAVAVTKGGALDDVVASLTELGVAHIEPVRTARTVVRWDEARAATAVARWQSIAREAAMQSRRATVPRVAPLAALATLAGRADVVVADRAGAPASTCALPAGDVVTVVVGPEGGLEPDELARLASAPRVAVGPYTLRAQTAPLAVVAALASRQQAFSMS